MFTAVRHLVGLAVLLAALLPAVAQADPAARVGRISLLEGPTLFRVNRDDAGSDASLNWPITSGAILDSEQGSRAEVWIGSTAYRLGGDSRVEFAAVDDRSVTVQQAAGTLAITIRDRDQADDIEVRTPNGRVQFGGPGRYRIDVGTGRTNVAASSGSAYVYGRDRSLTVDPGRTASIDERGEVTLYGQSLHDGFDDWVTQRDAATRPRTTQRYVSPAMTGYQDLDTYGDWGSLPDYGNVWYPRAVPMGWAPYRQGRWAWVEPWGWTWIDAAPWGFAPFHYGRWVEIRGRWGWIPGTYVARPVYAPALVGWIGNPGWSISLSIGSGPAVGWFPLAPREVFVPVYRSSPAYVRQINVTHVTNVTVINRALSDHGPRHFVHRESPRAVTVVPANALREGTPIRASSWSGQDRRELRQAPVSARAPAASWLAPAAGASRPGTPEGRERDAQRGSFRPEALPRPGGDRQPAPTGGPVTPLPPVQGPGAHQQDSRRNGFGGTQQLPAEQRPLPPGIDRLPAQPRSEKPGGESAPAQRANGVRQAPPTVITTPVERPRQELRREDRPPAATAPERPEVVPHRPASPIPAPEHPRLEPRQAPMERSAPLPTPIERRFEPAAPVASESPRQREFAPSSQSMPPPQTQAMPAPSREPAMERRVERPAPMFNEPPRQREMSPPPQPMRMPQPQAMPTPMREPQMERRGPPAEPRRHERNDQGNGPRM